VKRASASAGFPSSSRCRASLAIPPALRLTWKRFSATKPAPHRTAAPRRIRSSLKLNRFTCRAPLYGTAMWAVRRDGRIRPVYQQAGGVRGGSAASPDAAATPDFPGRPARGQPRRIRAKVRRIVRTIDNLSVSSVTVASIWRPAAVATATVRERRASHHVHVAGTTGPEREVPTQAGPATGGPGLLHRRTGRCSGRGRRGEPGAAGRRRAETRDRRPRRDACGRAADCGVSIGTVPPWAPARSRPSSGVSRRSLRAFLSGSARTLRLLRHAMATLA
jgi:hypothetical protein